MAALRDPYILIDRFVSARGSISFGEFLQGGSYTVEEKNERDHVTVTHHGCRLRYVEDTLCFDRQGAWGSAYAGAMGKSVPWIITPDDIEPQPEFIDGNSVLGSRFKLRS